MFSKLLVANRGEIAVRIMRSARKLGLKTVAVYSGADRDAFHVQQADESYYLGKQELSETYLNIEKIIDIALRSGCGAVHPGYGFLAENEQFVKACEKAGLVFIGPHAEAIRLMGNKIESREFVSKLNIPMTRGITGTPKELLQKAGSIPLPILVKAAAGGGGKGMRIVNDYDELEQILETTSREAKNYFGNATIYIEKYIEEPRHIEVQVLGDNAGNVIHLFERECTIQRRYQKIIEESPSPTLTPEVREKMTGSAVAIAKAAGYNSAGTVEFLVDRDLNYYFLEMNTRIQVEHPVTEMVTGTDLIEEQILIAQGNPMRLKQEEISQNGHAIECRIYAEDPENNFLPSPGKITLYKEPSGENVRIDSAIDRASEIHSFYDPMIAKLVVWGEEREEAIMKSITSLNRFIVHGIKTNIAFLRGVLDHKAFLQNKISTRYCDDHTGDILQHIEAARNEIPVSHPLLSYALHNLNASRTLHPSNVWERIGYWRHAMKLHFGLEGKDLQMKVHRHHGSSAVIEMEENTYLIEMDHLTQNSIRFQLEDATVSADISTDSKGTGWVTLSGFNFLIKRLDLLNESSEYVSGGNSASEKNLFSPMPGKVLKVNVKKGDQVKRGKVMLVVEAMKMENNIVAEDDAVVENVTVEEGDMVDTDLQLIYLEKMKKEEN